MKTFLLIYLTCLSVQVTLATHLIGGYIQAKPVAGSGQTYEITVSLYMDQVSGTQAASQATSLSLCFGDGTYDLVSRQSQTLVLNKLVSQNIYRTTHTYYGPNTYVLTVSVPNRTIVQNITRASDQLFTLTTTISTNVRNQTPTPVFPEAGFQIGLNQKAIFSLKATDTEGDSLAYGLSRALTSTNNNSCANQASPSYLFPNDVTRQGTFKLNSRTGELVWDAPVQPGNYSIVITIFEYRNSVLISQTTHEITLGAVDLPGTPSTIPPYEPALEGTNSIITAINDYVDSDISFTTFPNPVDDLLQLVIQSSNLTTAFVQLLDVTGRQVHRLQFVKPARKHEQGISTSSLPSGVYVLRADIDGRVVVKKIVKK